MSARFSFLEVHDVASSEGKVFRRLVVSCQFAGGEAQVAGNTIVGVVVACNGIDQAARLVDVAGFEFVVIGAGCSLLGFFVAKQAFEEGSFLFLWFTLGLGGGAFRGGFGLLFGAFEVVSFTCVFPACVKEVELIVFDHFDQLVGIGAVGGVAAFL